MAKPWSQEFEQHEYDFESIEKELLEEKVVPHISVRHFTELDENGFPRIVSLYDGKRVEEFTVEDQIALSIDEDIRTYGKVRLELEKIISAQGYKYSFEGERIIVSPIEREEEIYLRLPNLEREEFLSLTKQLKENGAKFNPNLKKWYLPQGVDKSKFQEYISVSDGEKEQLQDRLKVKLTGLPVSDEMQEILDKLKRGEYIGIDSIKNTAEMKTAYSHINYATPTILLEGRQAEQANFARRLLDMGSATIDKKGKTHYDGVVENNSHLDIVIGLPASGKSSAIVDTISNEFHSRVIDNDEVKKMIPEFNDGWGASVVHAESQKITDVAFKIALKQGDNIVLPKVGSDADKLFHHYIMPAISAGYTVNLHYVELQREKALGRMINRFITDGRFLDPQLVDKYCNHADGNKIEKCFEQLKSSEYISGYSKWNNDVEYGQKPILAEYHNLETNYILSATQKKEEHNNVRENGNRERNRSTVDVRDNGSSRGGWLQSTIGNRDGIVERESYDGQSRRVVSSSSEVLYRTGYTTRDNGSEGRGNSQAERGNSEGRSGYESYQNRPAGMVSSDQKILSSRIDRNNESGQILSTADVEAEKKQIAKEINQTKKYEANRPLVEKIYSLNMIMDKKHSVADLANVFKNGAYKDNPDADKLIKDIGKEFIRQEQVRAVAR